MRGILEGVVVVRNNFAVYSQFPNPPGDQLAGLPAEIVD
jgi:hypothetical protein